jgi:hypothetical protein
MTWVVIAASALASWLAVALLLLGLCRAAALGDDAVTRAAIPAGGSASRATPQHGAVVIHLDTLPTCPRPARRRVRSPYLSRRDSRRSLSSLPSV